jgi:ribonuclease
VMRQVATLVVLAMTMVLNPVNTSPTALAMTPERLAANCSPGVPEKDCRTAEYVYTFVVSHNYAAPPGLKGNKPFIDEFGLLPAGGDYREYRLYGTPHSAERLVIDRTNPEGNSWFTGDHYASFVQFYLTL